MKIAIVGSRTYTENDYQYFCSMMNKHFTDDKEITLISGGGAGIDRFTEWYAKEKGMGIEVIRPDYIMYGKNAFIAKKIEMVKQADVVFAMWDGVSKDSKDCIVIGKKLGKKIIKEIYEGDGYDYLINSSYPNFNL